MKKLILATVVIGCFLLSSCGVFNQIQELTNLANCEYNLKNVTNIYVAGVNVKKVVNGNISMADIANLSSALLQKNIPLSMNVNVNVSNPTQQNAALSSMRWIMEIEGTEFASGINAKPYSIKAGKSTIIPLNVTTDIYSLFSNHSLESLKTFVRSFGNDGTSSKIRFRVKPSLNVNGVEIPSPAYINLEKKVGGSTTTSTPSNKPKPKSKSSQFNSSSTIK